MFSYLAEAVGLIIKCDSVFQTSQLKNIWPKYISAIGLFEKNSTNLFGNIHFSNSDLTGFETVLSKIGYLLTGHLFQVNLFMVTIEE